MSRKYAALSLVVAGLVGAVIGARAEAAPMTAYMSFSDINPPILGVAGFDGTKFVSLPGVDTFTVTDGVSLSYTDAQFQITSGFTVPAGSALVTDSNGSSSADAGDLVSATLGSGAFQIVSASKGVLVSGTFTSAGLNTSVGSSAVTINSANVRGLDLTPGPELTSHGIMDFVPSESFALNIVGISSGVQISGATPAFSGHYLASLQAFGMGPNAGTSGSVDLVAGEVVPEPASIGLLSVGALGLLARRRRQA